MWKVVNVLDDFKVMESLLQIMGTARQSTHGQVKKEDLKATVIQMV